MPFQPSFPAHPPQGRLRRFGAVDGGRRHNSRKEYWQGPPFWGPEPHFWTGEIFSHNQLQEPGKLNGKHQKTSHVPCKRIVEKKKKKEENPELTPQTNLPWAPEPKTANVNRPSSAERAGQQDVPFRLPGGCLWGPGTNHFVPKSPFFTPLPK